MRQDDRLLKANRRLATKLLLVCLAMFGFGYALVPLYDVLCDITGLNGKTGRVDTEVAQVQKIDSERWVTVEFTGSAMEGLPWEFRPMQNKIRVHPGEIAVVNYYARNVSNETIVGQAVPSVTPGKAAAKFDKIECFCFSQQELKAGEAKEMPVRFVVDASLSKDVNTITLSYAFFNSDKVSAKRYGSGAQPASDRTSHIHPAVPVDELSI